MTLAAGSRLGPYEIHVTPDGERFLVNLRPGDQVSDPITLVLNWAAGRE